LHQVHYTYLVAENQLTYFVHIFLQSFFISIQQLSHGILHIKLLLLSDTTQQTLLTYEQYNNNTCIIRQGFNRN